MIIFGVVQNNQKIYARIMRQSTRGIGDGTSEGSSPAEAGYRESTG